MIFRPSPKTRSVWVPPKKRRNITPTSPECTVMKMFGAKYTKKNTRTNSRMNRRATLLSSPRTKRSRRSRRVSVWPAARLSDSVIFHDGAVLHFDDAVGVLPEAFVVSHRDHRLPLIFEPFEHHFIKIPAEMRVLIGGPLVEDHDFL